MTYVYELNVDYWLKKDFISNPFKRLLSTIQPGSQVLDLGCGGGRLALALAGVARTWGMDRAGELITQLKSKHSDINWVDGDAELAADWKSLPTFDYVVSNVCIRKDQCRLDRVLLNSSKHSPKATLLIKLQGSEDLKGYIHNPSGYTRDEISKAFKDNWSVEIAPERYRQKFTSGEYLKESITKIGLRPTRRAQGNTELAVSREFWLLKAALKS